MRGKARSWGRFIMCTCKSWRLTKWTIRIQAVVPFLPSAQLKITVALLPPSESTSKIRFRLYLWPTQNQPISSAPFTIITHFAFLEMTQSLSFTLAHVWIWLIGGKISSLIFIMMDVWCVRVLACVRAHIFRFVCWGRNGRPISPILRSSRSKIIVPDEGGKLTSSLFPEDQDQFMPSETISFPIAETIATVPSSPHSPPESRRRNSVAESSPQRRRNSVTFSKVQYTRRLSLADWVCLINWWFCCSLKFSVFPSYSR
jgi:hypothetical protein